MNNSSTKVKGYSSEEIKKLLSSNQDYMVGVRLHIVHKASLGQSSRALSKSYGVSYKQITNWIHRFEQEGLDGLADKKGRGRKGFLDEQQLELLKELVLNESPKDHDYNASKWTGPMITDWINKTFKTTYKEAQVYNLLDKLEIVFTKGRGFIKKNNV